MNKIDKIAKRKELLENGYSFDFKRSIDENGEVKSEEIWITENKYGFYIQQNEFNLREGRVFDCFNELHKLKQYKWKRHVIQIDTKEKFMSYIYTLKNIAPWQIGGCYYGRIKVILSSINFKTEVELTEEKYSGGIDWILHKDHKFEWLKKLDGI